MKLEGRYAIITGASQGLGLAIAERFVAEGASIVICARGAEALDAARMHLVEASGMPERAFAVRADVANVQDIDAVVEFALARFGRIDVLVNNAGVYGPLGAIEDVDWREWVSALEINILGTIYPCRAAIPVMRRQRRGKIINISGGGATSPMPRITAYAASKAAIVRFTESLAFEVCDAGIDVNAIAPGALATRLLTQVIDAGPNRVGADFHARMLQIQKDGGTPLAKAAALCVYLASSESDGITGRLISAIWDPWPTLHEHREALRDSDIYTLRRIVPSDRGQNWDD